MSTLDVDYMHYALRLAQRGLGTVWPNPAVGCVIISNHRVVGTGYTQKGGRPHAETMALTMAGEKARGSTAYVTLEPCAHYGHTPPCALSLIEAGVARVVVACSDPDPRVNGGGIAMLKQAGIEVTVGILEEQARVLNAGFFNRVQMGRPFVTAKIAASLDGKTALKSGKSQWITGETARARGHLLRAQYDAILVGTNTVLADDCRLSCRLAGLEHQSPVRIVLDGRGRIPKTAAIFQATDQQQTWVVGRHAPQKTRLIDVPYAAGQVDLKILLQTLGDMGITRLLIEGGSTLISQFYRLGLLDCIVWFGAAKILGGDSLNAIAPLDLGEIPPNLTIYQTSFADGGWQCTLLPEKQF